MTYWSLFLSKLVAAGGHPVEIALTTVIVADIDVAAEIVADHGHDLEIASTDDEQGALTSQNVGEMSSFVF